MNVYSTVPGANRLASIPALANKAKQRLKLIDYYNSHDHNARLTCRYLGISPQSYYRWKKRCDPWHLESLADRSCRPKRVHQPNYSKELVKAVQELREEYPRWGKDKLVVLLHRQGFNCSTCTVGRIIRRLRARAVLKEPVINPVSAHRRGIRRPYAVRKPKDYQVNRPGDLIQLDTLDIRPLPRMVLKQLTARDAISR